jgi:hypothetical protein
MRWAALGVSPLPELTLDLTVQAGDARGAKGIHAMFLQVIEALGKPASAPAKEPAPGRIMLSMLALAPELVQPQIKGDQVFFHLGPKEMDRVVAELTPVLRKDRQAASARNVRAMLKGCIMYCANNNDQWPPDLDALVKDGLAPRMLTNPCRPSAKPGYIYVKPKAGADGNPVVIYEAYGQWPGSIAVGLADGHAKVVKSEQEFKDLLAGKAPASASPPGGQP